MSMTFFYRSSVWNLATSRIWRCRVCRKPNVPNVGNKALHPSDMVTKSLVDTWKSATTFPNSKGNNANCYCLSILDTNQWPPRITLAGVPTRLFTNGTNMLRVNTLCISVVLFATRPWNDVQLNSILRKNFKNFKIFFFRILSI